MDIAVLQTLAIPLIGTSLGAGSVLFFHHRMNREVEKGMNGFAAGVMVAASIWSLLIPAMEESVDLGKLAFLPAAIGFWIGTFFMLAIDKLVPHLHGNESEGMEGVEVKRSTMLFLAVTIHNIPEGMALGVVIAGWLSHNVTISAGSALGPLPWVSPFKTFRKVPLSPSPWTQEASGAKKPSATASSPAS